MEARPFWGGSRTFKIFHCKAFIFTISFFFFMEVVMVFVYDHDIKFPFKINACKFI